MPLCMLRIHQTITTSLKSRNQGRGHKQLSKRVKDKEREGERAAQQQQRRQCEGLSPSLGAPSIQCSAMAELRKINHMLSKYAT